MERERVILLSTEWKNPKAIADLAWKACGAAALKRSYAVSGSAEICKE